MKTMNALLVLMLMGIADAAEPAAKPDAQPREEKVEAPAAELPVGKVDDEEWVKSHMGQKVVMRGLVSDRSVISEQGHFFYHFEGTKFVMFCHKLDANDVPMEKKPESLRGKTIQVTGKLSMYREKAQLRIRDGKEIEVMP